MTQISLKLFNKLPFARNDIGNLRGAGRAGRAGKSPHVQVVLCQARCMHVRISVDLSKRRPDRSWAASASIVAVLSCRS